MHDNDVDQSDAQEVVAKPVEIPFDALSAETLTAVIESFILREGTDYGTVEISHDTKIQQVRRQIEKGEIKITFDPGTESVTLMTKPEWLKRK